MQSDPEALKQANITFNTQSKKAYSLGYFKDTLWIKVLLDINPEEIHVFEIDKPSLSEITFFFTLKDGSIKIIDKNEMLKYRNPSLIIPIDTDVRKEIYIRIKSSVAFNFEFRIWNNKNFHSKTLKDYLLFGIIYGIMISMFLYNGIILIITWDKSYLYFIIFGLSSLLWGLLIYGHLDILIEIQPVYRDYLMMISVSVVWFSTASFIRSFLKTKTITPGLDKIITITILFSILMFILGTTGLTMIGHILNSVLCLVLPPIAFKIGFKSLKSGFRPALYFLIAWTVFLLGAIMYALAGSVIPRNALTLNTYITGAAISSVLLSFAMADTIKTVRNENRVLNLKTSTLKRKTLTDGLTKIHNRASFTEKMEQEVNNARINGYPLSIVMIDVDNFKKYNDTWGHPAGDEVLIKLGKILKESVRDKDYACRYGGEEFTLILPGITADQAAELAERIRRNAEKEVYHPNDNSIIQTVTLSAGIAEFRKTDTVRSLTERADKALYKAKENGRNRIIKTIR